MSEVGQALSTACWIAVGAFVFLDRWRSYRVDALRQRLFELRDELFDFAYEGGIDFDHPAYGATRVLMNRLIRFGHKVTLTRVAMAILGNRLQVFAPTNPWAAVEALPDGPAKAKLASIHMRISLILIKHILGGAVLLWVPLGCLVLYQVLYLRMAGAIKKLSDEIFRKLAETLCVPLLESMADAVDA